MDPLEEDAASATPHETLVSWLRITATVCSIVQFLSGSDVMRDYVRKGSTGDTSSFPYVAGALMCAVWLKYGLVIGESVIVLVNSVGACLLTCYTICFYYYSLRKTMVLRQTVFAVTFYLTLLFLLNSQDEAMVKEVLGFLGAFFSVLFCASPLANVGQVIKTRTTETLPYYMILLTFLVTLQWWLFGYLIQDGFLAYPNMLGCILSALQLALFLVYPSSMSAKGAIKKSWSQEQLI